MVGKLTALVRRARLAFQLRRIYTSDSKYQLKYLKDLSPDGKDRSDAEIMLVMHALEKGLSFREKKTGFGKEKSSSLVDMLERHIGLYGIDSQVVVATNILDNYLKDPSSTDDVSVRGKIEQYLSSHKDLLRSETGGVKKVSAPQGNPSYEEILAFYGNRSSVREFSSVPLSEEEIDKAIAIASTTPSACNRQASRVYVVQDREKLKGLMENQLGDQGWCNGADTLFIVTEVATYFGSSYERRQPFIDGGMFAMNLVMGLHAQGIASCCKMYVRDPRADKAVRKLIGIPENEMPIVLILAGHYPDHEVTSPLSKRNEIAYKTL